VTTVTLRQSEKARPEFRYSASLPRLVAGRSSKVWKISAPRFALPGELTQPSVTLASFGGKKEPVRPDSTTQQAAAQQAVQQANTAATTMATSSATQAPAGAAPAPAAGKYTGEPISVNLKDVDLKDFFRLIHEISGLNVVLDPAVKGSLTIVLDEVPWDQALDIVMQNNSLDKQLNGNVLRIATRSTLKNEAETQRDLEKAQAEAIAPVTVTRVLSYAKAASMAPTLKKFLSSRGDILYDDRSNQVIIRDIPSVIPILDNLIRQLDRKSQQVEIEARVVSASRSFAIDIGTQLGFAGSTSSGRSIAGGDSAVGTSDVSNFGPPFYQTAGTTSLPLNTNLGAGAPTSGIFLGHRSPNFAVDFFITAAEAKGVGKLLSKPKVITQNNEKATVKQGTKIPIQTTINNTISVQFIDAVLKLEVTPQITAEGTVFMDVLVENTQIDAGIPRVSGIPALDTESAETKVTVADGGTVVIGGIIISTQRTDIQQVPLVGSLPLIGHLFKRTSVSTTSQELMFFLTPRIIPG
jgi:type IV pilus assembly protein PilQ